MKKELRPYKKQIRAIEKIFKHENISACIVDVKETNEKIMYYIDYIRFISPYDIAVVVDSFAIALGGVKLIFIPVIENKPYSALLVDKCVDSKIQSGIAEYKNSIEYQVIKKWVSNKKFVSEIILRNEFGLDNETANNIVQKLLGEKLIRLNKYGIYSTVSK